jgi:hypothetical protein
MVRITRSSSKAAKAAGCTTEEKRPLAVKAASTKGTKRQRGDLSRGAELAVAAAADTGDRDEPGDPTARVVQRSAVGTAAVDTDCSGAVPLASNNTAHKPAAEEEVAVAVVATAAGAAAAPAAKKIKYKNVYCMPVKPQTVSDDDIFGKKNKHVFFGNCPCCE